MTLNRALQKPEESVRRPATLDDTVLLSEEDNDVREIIAEIDPETIAQTLNGIVSQLRQLAFGTEAGRRWSDVPATTLMEIVSLMGGWGLSEWVAGEDLEKGELVYGGPESDTVHKASYSDLANTNIVGMAYDSQATGEKIKIAHNGKTIGGFTGLVPGRHYFLQDNGKIGAYNPSSLRGTYTLRVGYAKTNDVLLLNIGEPRVRP